MPEIRLAAVAGLFYPDSPDQLRDEVDAYLARASTQCLAETDSGDSIKAIIVPHAGYQYSGQCAAYAYARIQANAEHIERVVLLGPAHREAFQGIALPDCRQFETPLGCVPLATAQMDRLLKTGMVHQRASAHMQEHSLEVQLPFLQRCLHTFDLLPLLVGDADTQTIAMLLESVWGGKETLIVVSTDLSHFHPYECAEVIDAATCRNIESMNPNLSGDQACGCRPLNGLLTIAKRKDMHIDGLYRCNSGDAGGPRERVVGYAAYAMH